jgi:hypothetical protein
MSQDKSKYREEAYELLKHDEGFGYKNLWVLATDVLAKVLEDKADCEGCREIISDKGSDRECGHFVREIMSYCPVCQEIASLQQQIKLEKWSI